MPANAYRLSILIFVHLILIAQLVNGFIYHAGTRWPIISYPMYSGAQYDGARLGEYSMTLVHADGTEHVVEPAEFGLRFWLFRKNIIGPFLEEDAEGQARARAILCGHGTTLPTGITIHNTGHYITSSGLAQDTPELVVNLPDLCTRK